MTNSGHNAPPSTSRGSKRKRADEQGGVKKRRRREILPPIYVTDISVEPATKEGILRWKLASLSTTDPYSSLVSLTTDHKVGKGTVRRMKDALTHHECGWGCHTRALDLEEFSSQKDIRTYMPKGSVNDEVKSHILGMAVAEVQDGVATEYLGALVEEHNILVNGVEDYVICLRTHHCNAECRVRVTHAARYRFVQHQQKLQGDRPGGENRSADPATQFWTDAERKQYQRDNTKREKEERDRISLQFWREAWPVVEAEATLKDLLQEGIDKLRPEALQHVSCSFCNASLPKREIHEIEIQDLDFSRLTDNIRRFNTRYPKACAGVYGKLDGNHFNICTTCKSHTRKNEKTTMVEFVDVPVFSWANGCWIGEEPDQLKHLTYVEELVIARAHATKCWVKLNCRGGHKNDPTAQRASSGNVCIHPHEILKVAERLPRPINTLFNEIAVIIVNGDKYATSSMFERTPLLARRGHILRALLWLKEHNPLYKDVVIDYEALNDYTESGEVPFPTQIQRENATIKGESTTYTGHGPNELERVAALEEGGDVLILRTGSVDVNVVEKTLQARKLEALQHIKGGGQFLKTHTGTSTLSSYDTPETFGFLFPTLFPYGCGYIDDPIRSEAGFSRVKLALHVRHLLRLADTRFQRHTSFIFVMHNIISRRQSSHKSRLAVNRTWWPNAVRIMRDIDTVAVEQMKDTMMKKRMAKDFSLYEAKNQQEKDILQLLRYVNYVDDHLEGSVGQIVSMREELRAISRSCGTPALFFTLNPADAHHPLTAFLAGYDIDLNRTFVNPDSRYTCFSRAQILASNPVAGARFFEFFVKRFVSTFLGCDRPDKRGVFGRVKYYYAVAENQNRGSLHFHMLIWLEGALSPRKLQERCSEDNVFRQRFFDWLESIIKLSIPNGPVEEGSETSYETKKRALIGLPPDPRDPEFEALWPQFLREVLDNSAQMHAHGDVCFKKISRAASTMSDEEKDQLCRFHLPAEIVNETYIDEDGKLHLRRDHPMVVGYNPLITGAHQCNTDLKFIGSGRLGMAMSVYMTYYTAKSSMDSAIMMSALSAALASLKAKFAGRPQTEQEEQCRLLLVKTLNQMTGRRELSAQQVASSLLGIKNHFTNAKFARVYWSSVLSWICKEEFPPWQTADKEESGSNEAMDPNHETDISNDSLENRDHIEANDIHPGNEQWIFLNEDDARLGGDEPPRQSLIHDIFYRPPELKGMCMWEQMSLYKKVTLKSLSEKQESKAHNGQADDDEKEATIFKFPAQHPQHSTHVLKRRTTTHIPVLIGRPIPRRDDGELGAAYCIAMLVLFKPWSSSSKDVLRENGETWIDCFQNWNKNADNWKIELMDHFQEQWECQKAADYFASTASHHGPDPSGIGEIDDDDGDVYATADDPNFCFGQASDDDDPEDRVEGDIEDEFSVQGSHRAMLQIQELLALATASSLYDTPTERRTLYDKVVPKMAEVEPNNRSESIAAAETIAKEKAACRGKAMTAVQKKNQPIVGVSDFETVRRERALEPMLTTIIEERKGIERRLKRSKGKEYDKWCQLHLWQQLAAATSEAFTLNERQRLAFLIITNHRLKRLGDTELQPLRLIIGGPGGSGKSHIYEALRAFYGAVQIANELAFTAPTGISADGIQGSTVHSYLSLHVQYDNLTKPTSKAREQLQRRLSPVQNLVIDELARSVTTDAFAELDVVLSGDEFQLPCPLGRTLYDWEFSSITESTSRVQGQSDNTKKDAKGFEIFRSFSNVVMLTELVRQRNKRHANNKSLHEFTNPLNRYVEFINRLRRGICTTSGHDNDLDYLKQFQLKSEETEERVLCVDQWIKDPWQGSPLITYTNSIRDMHNWKMADTFARATGQTFCVYYAEDTATTKKRGRRVLLTGENAEAAWNTPAKRHADDLSGRLPLVIGMPIILVENLAVELGLCKGTRGILTGVTYFVREGRRIAVSAEIARGADSSSGKLNTITIPTFRRTIQYRRNGEWFSVRREQLPLIPGFAFTIHNSQSQSVNSCTLHLESSPNTAASYVMMSRIKCDDAAPININIIGEIESGKISTHASLEVREEERRLKALAEITKSELSEELSWYTDITGVPVFT